MKWYIILLTAIILLTSVTALEGGIIVGDSQIFETAQAKMVVTPHTAYSSNNNYYQQFEITNKLGTNLNNIWFAFRFNERLSSSEVCELVTTYVDVNATPEYVTDCIDRSNAFIYSMVGNKHYYYLTSTTDWTALETRKFDIYFSYVTPQQNSKYDLAIWSGSFDCIIDDSCPFSRILDPYTEHVNESLTTELIAYYDMTDETDLIQGNDATNSGVVFGAGGINGDAGTFVKTDPDKLTIPDQDYLSFTDGAGNDDPFSISFWFYLNTRTTSMFFIDKMQQTNIGEWLMYVSANGYVGFYAYDSGNDRIAIITNIGSVVAGGWYHVVATYDGSNTFGGINIYLNGSNANWVSDSGGTYNGMSNTANNITVGALGSATSDPLDGIMDEIAIFDYELSTGDVTDLFNSGAGEFYPFNLNPSVNSSDDPIDGSTIAFTTSVTLNVTVFDPDSDNLNVTFYNSTGHLIDYMDDVNVNTSWKANVTYSGLTSGFYEWSVNVTDGQLTNYSDTFNFTISSAILKNASIKKFSLPHPDVTFTSIGIKSLNATFNATAGDRFIIESSFNARRGIAGASTDLFTTFTIDGVAVGTTSERVVTLTTGDKFYSTGKDSNIFTAPSTKTYEFIVTFNKTGSGTVNVSDVDIIFRKGESSDNKTVLINSTRIDKTFSNTAMSVIGSFNMTKYVTSGTSINMKQTYTSGANDNLISCQISHNDVYSMTVPRWLAGINDKGSSSLSYIDDIEDTSHQHNLTCSQTKAGTSTYNASIFYMDMRDNVSTLINHAKDIYRDDDKSLTAGTYDIINRSIEIISGDSVYVAPSVSLLDTGASSFDVGVQVLADGVICSKKTRTFSTINKEVGNTFIYGSCDNLSVGWHNITLRVIVPATKSVTLLNNSASLNVIESLTIPITTAEVPPILLSSCLDVTLYHNQNLVCQNNASDINNPTINYEWKVNDSRLNMTIAGLLTDNPTLSDYNLPGCWDVTSTVNNTVGLKSSSFKYCINNTAPTFNETIPDATAQSSLTFNYTGNFSDAQNDNATLIVSCDGLTFSLDNSSHTYNLFNSSQSGVLNCDVSLSDGVSNTSQSFTLTVTQPLDLGVIEVGVCPNTMVGQLTFWSMVSLMMLIILFAVMFDAPLLGVMGAVGLIVLSWTVVACLDMMGYIFLFSALVLILYFAFKMFE